MNKFIASSLFLVTPLLGSSFVELDLEGLYLQRGGSRNKVLIQQQNSSTSTVYTKKITASKIVHRLGYEPGFRITLGGQGNSYGGFVRALITNQAESKKKTTGNLLSYPFTSSSYAPEWSNGYKAINKYRNGLTVIDAYFSSVIAPTWKDYFGAKYLVGLQYFNLPEDNKLSLYSTLQAPFQGSLNVYNTYHATANNDALLAALGFYFQMRPLKTFAFELIGYGGLGANYASTSTKLKGLNDTLIRRSSNEKAIGPSYSFISSVRLTYKPYDFFELSGSYEFLCLSGMALAYRQMSYGVKSSSDNQVHRNGSATFQGFALRVGFIL